MLLESTNEIPSKEDGEDDNFKINEPMKCSLFNQ
jgi:hypothetical protein